MASGFTATHDSARVAAGFRRGAEDLADLEATNAQAGRLVLGAANPPRATSALAEGMFATADPTGVVMASRVGYFTAVHWGAPARNITARPFLIDARRQAEDQVVGLYADHLRRSFTDNL